MATFERSQLLDIDFAHPLTENPAALAVIEPEVRNVKRHNAHLDDAQAGAAPRTEAETKSALALLSHIGLGWNAIEQPIFARSPNGQYVQVPARKALIRSDSGAVIGDVGENYGVVQNDTMAELADAVRGLDGYTWGQGGALRGGSRVFLQLKSPARNVGGELIESNISIFNSFDGSLKFSAGFSDTVVVCKNTFLAARLDAQQGMLLRHTSGVEQRIETAIKLLEAARKHTEAVDNGILSMMSRKITNDQVEALVQRLVKGDSKRAENARLAILDAYVKAPGAAVGTAWGAFQAATYYATHSTQVRQTSGRTETEARIESSWWGTGAGLTQDAWDVLVDEEKVEQLQYVRVVRAS